MGAAVSGRGRGTLAGVASAAALAFAAWGLGLVTLPHAGVVVVAASAGALAGIAPVA